MATFTWLTPPPRSARRRGTDNTGSLLLGPDGSLDLSGAVATSGTVSLATGASLSATGPLLNDGEVVALGTGALLAPDGLTNHARVDVDPAASLAVASDLVSDGTLAVPADATLATTGDLLNAGRLKVGATGRVEPGGAFTQDATGLLRIGVTDTSVGRVAAEGVRDLAGRLLLRLETDEWPPLGTRRRSSPPTAAPHRTTRSTSSARPDVVASPPRRATATTGCGCESWTPLPDGSSSAGGGDVVSCIGPHERVDHLVDVGGQCPAPRQQVRRGVRHLGVAEVRGVGEQGPVPGSC